MKSILPLLIRSLLVAGLAGLCLPSPAGAAPNTIRVKLSTIVPAGTSYQKSLMTMRDKWRQASGGRVQLTIFAGTQGSEAEFVGMMQTGNTTAALLSVTGLGHIERATTAISCIPLGFQSLDEVDYVTQHLRSKLEPLLLAKGYVALCWLDSGWVRFFSKQPMVRPDDLKNMKLFCWAGDVSTFDLWKKLGFSPVQLETADILPQLTTGMIQAVPMPPFWANAQRLDARAPNMLDLNYAPIGGAAVIRKSTWDSIPPEIRPELLKIAEATGREITLNGRAESQAAIRTMQERGMKVHALTPQAKTEWQNLADQANREVRGKIVPADMFDEVQRLLKQYRATKQAQK